MSILTRFFGAFRTPPPQPIESGAMSRLEPVLTDIQATLNALYRTSLYEFQASSWAARERLLERPEFAAPLRLERFGYKVYSQNDEDGIIAEIFRRIGTTNRVFVEFGVENGLENNTLNLLTEGWTGCWIEASSHDAAQVRTRFASALRTRALQLRESMVDCANINALLDGFNLPQEIDLLSVDIDGNDYHVWKAIERITPRVAVVEYNAKFRPPSRWVMTYNPRHTWDGTDQCGSSLAALTDLAGEKGYRLVGCSIVGSNAFFVRSGLAAGLFEEPATAEHFYQPARYFLTPGYVSGHKPGFGKGSTADPLIRA
jgi:hypothetical protein